MGAQQVGCCDGIEVGWGEGEVGVGLHVHVGMKVGILFVCVKKGVRIEET